MVGTRLELAQTSIAAERMKCEKLRLQKLGLMQDLLTGKVPVKVAPNRRGRRVISYTKATCSPPTWTRWSTR